jgi:uncharacterized protein
VIIDAHAHVHTEAGGLGEKQDASVDVFLNEFDASPLDAAVLLPIEPMIPTDFVFDVVEQRPGKLYGFGSVDPKTDPSCVAALENLADAHDIRGLKLHPRRQGLSCADLPVLKPLVEKATQFELPVLIDSFPYGKGAMRDDTLEMVEALSEAVPQARLIIAHMGGVRILDALILARTSYTIFLDLSLIYAVYQGSHIEDDVFYSIRRIGADRCLYGSDYPDVGLSDSYEAMRGALDARGFSASDQDYLFGKTASELLGI